MSANFELKINSAREKLCFLSTDPETVLGALTTNYMIAIGILYRIRLYLLTESLRRPMWIGLLTAC